jgi:zinc transporter ZupT
MYLAPFVVTVLLIFFHILGEKFSEHIERFHTELISFGAGLMVGIFFLEILPQIAVGETYLSHLVYVTFLAGFVLIHVLEKLVYQRALDESEFAGDVTRFKMAGLTTYALLVGIIVVVFFEAYGDLAYFIFAPFFVRAFALSMSSRHINEKINSKLNRAATLILPLFGTIIGLLLIADKTHLFLVFSLTMGFILYIVIRDMIPIGREGKPLYFIVGVLLTIATFLIFQK